MAVDEEHVGAGDDAIGDGGPSQGHAHRVTIRDVAREVGVSPSTVSRAFARPGRVSAATARRIREVSDRLGYRVDPISSYDPTGGMTGQIAIVVSDLANPIFADYVKAAQHRCLDLGYGLLVIDSEETGAIEKNAVELARPHVDGIILGSSRRSDSAIRKLAETKPVIALNRSIRGVKSIIGNVQTGLEAAVNHLVGLGHTEITYISGPQTSWQEGTRWRVMTALCSVHGLRLKRIPSDSPSFSGGYRCAEAFLKNQTSAVLAFNDMIAIGFIAALRAQHISVPGQVSVIGIDDIPVSSLVTPALTSVRMPRRETASLAVDEMVGRLRRIKVHEGMKPIVVDSTFVVRASTAPLSR